MSQRLSNALKNRARAWAGQLTSLAKSFAPNHLKAYVRSRVDEQGTKIIIRTSVNRFASPKEKYGTLDARAQEYGSGLRARRGPKAKYPIVPKSGKKFLAFHWEVAEEHPEVASFLPDGRFLISKVNHPGIPAANAGQGYIGPAVKELRKRARVELNKDVRQAILGDLRQSFGKK